MALNENAVRREERAAERTERSMQTAATTAIGFASVHSPTVVANGPSAPRV